MTYNSGHMHLQACAVRMALDIWSNIQLFA